MDNATLVRPKFRSSVQIELMDDHAIATAPAGTYILSFPRDARPAIARLIDALHHGGVDSSDLERHHSEIDDVPELIERLDSLHLLTETAFMQPTGIISGAQLDREVRRMVRRRQQLLAKSSFYLALRNSSASRRQVIGYVLEYYWLVRAAPGLIAPSLATAPNLVARQVLQEFIASEFNHDRYLAESLRGAGIDSDFTYLQPLPTTFQICASLGAYAQQHPLSFQALLFLFEQPQPDFIDAFEVRCVELGLPVDFYAPLRRHSNINEDAEHSNISTRLLSLTAAVDLEERVVVLRNAAVLVESMLQQEDEILDYYGNDWGQFPRIFE